MHLSTRNDVRSPPESGDLPSLLACPSSRRSKAPAPPPLTSGYGVLLEKEEKLLATTGSYLGDIHGAHAPDLWRILREHQLLLEANQAMLWQRCERLPHARRFERLHQDHQTWSQAPGSAALESMSSLPDLVSRHASLIGDLDALIARAGGGEIGEPILAAMERNHEEMAWMLMALIKEDETPLSDEASDWDNEGGGPRAGRLDLSLQTRATSTPDAPGQEEQA